MRFRPPFPTSVALALAALLPFSSAAFAKENATPKHPGYETRTEHDRDGTGTFYMGREIALVMGHLAVGWLERPEREAEERTDLLLDGLKLKEGDVVGDIGAGSGYFSWRIGKAVGEKGAVYAVDIQKEMLEVLARNMGRRGVQNVKPILGTNEDPKLPPATLDIILMVDVYHEFDRPFEMTGKMLEALKPGGRLIFVEYRGEDPEIQIKPLHKMTEAQVRKEMAIWPAEWVETLRILPQQHMIVFRKK
ncbi:MAG: class I SAM-dependent methyltransferase [Chthoniobacteraceae bacterium]